MPRAPKTALARTAGRTPWGTITREQIVEVALRVVRTRGGYEQMTIRSLAADMGVSAMSLYRHVRDKDDLLDEVVDRLLARTWKPKGDPADWRAWVLEAEEKLRRFLVSQPAALYVFLAHPVVSPAALARMNAILVVFRDAVGDEQSAQRAYAAIHAYTVGFSALQGSRAGREPAGGAGATRLRAAGSGRRAEGLAPISPDSDVADPLAAFITSQQFAQGLRYLLDGVDRSGGQPGRRRQMSRRVGPRNAN